MSLFVRLLPCGCKIEDIERQISVRLNNQGYWCTFRQGAEFYRRCLDGSIVVGAQACVLGTDQYPSLHHRVIHWLNLLEDENPIVIRAKQQTADDYLNLVELYEEAYPEPVTILPPDRYQDVVLQPARGCPNRQCTFCAFYKDKPYQVLSDEQLDQHFQAVQQLFGSGLEGRDGVFLGSANALALSQKRLLPVFIRIQQQFPNLKRGIACFADPDFSARRSGSDWQALADFRLQHVIIGLETGWPELRASLGKSGDLNKTRRQVAQLQDTGIGIGITLLTGICDTVQSSRHLEETVEFIETLKLQSTDMVYLSPFSHNGKIENRAVTEQQRLKEMLKKQIPAKVVPYQVQRFNYYS